MFLNAAVVLQVSAIQYFLHNAPVDVPSLLITKPSAIFLRDVYDIWRAFTQNVTSTPTVKVFKTVKKRLNSECNPVNLCDHLVTGDRNAVVTSRVQPRTQHGISMGVRLLLPQRPGNIQLKLC